jgi:hypothetical protein
MLGIGEVHPPNGRANAANGLWNTGERELLQKNIASRQPFLDLILSRTNSDGSRQSFRVSGEPMFNQSSRFTGYRGIGVEILAKN